MSRHKFCQNKNKQQLLPTINIIQNIYWFKNLAKRCNSKEKINHENSDVVLNININF